MAQRFQAAEIQYLKHLFPSVRITKSLETGAVTDLITDLSYAEVLAILGYTGGVSSDAFIGVAHAALHVATAAGSAVTVDVGIAAQANDTNNVFFDNINLNSTGTTLSTITRPQNLGRAQHIVAKASTDIGTAFVGTVQLDVHLMRRYTI